MGHRVDKGRVNNTASELATQTPLIKVELELGPPLGVLASKDDREEDRKISLTNSVGILYGGDGDSGGSSVDGGDGGGGGSGRCGSFHKRAVTRGTLEAGFQDPGSFLICS
ncbi:hypothetical protein HZH66_003469 [Vespula vulgaris]|uniref:Uncharacterized protein n=1 Tax=Vespula vulgaris TaxID=7454 RepID=A0A834KD65_VESVU|nr:hypothetical protein HZH66_003469 [Vespula vulgaris]